jgi:hypothetical protein
LKFVRIFPILKTFYKKLIFVVLKIVPLKWVNFRSQFLTQLGEN